MAPSILYYWPPVLKPTFSYSSGPSPCPGLLTIWAGASLGPQGPRLHRSSLPTVLPFQGGHAACSSQPQGPACLFLGWWQGWRRQVWGEACVSRSPASPTPGPCPSHSHSRHGEAVHEQPKIWVRLISSPARRTRPWFPACTRYGLSPCTRLRGPLTPRTVLPPVGNSLGLLPNSGTGSLKWRGHLPRCLPGSPCSIRTRREEQVRGEVPKGDWGEEETSLGAGVGDGEEAKLLQTHQGRCWPC